ncbi:inner membrane protein [Escherichia coli]|nr:inner membrane protein [Escherichia coli]
MSLYQHMLVFYAVMAAIAFLITWFLSHDKKRIRFLSAFLVGATWPMSFPVALLFSLFLNLTHWLDGTTQTYIIWMNR